MNTDTPLAFLWFTFGPDAECLLLSVAAAKAAAPHAALHVKLDPVHPFPHPAIDSLREMGAIVSGSTGTHGGNLNGAEHVDHQLAELGEAAGPDHGRGMVVKIDSDTIVRSLDWLAPAFIEASPVIAVGFEAGPHAPWCGPCYALRAGIPQLLRSTLATVLRQGRDRRHQPFLLPAGLPEDATTCALLKASGRKGILRWPSYPVSRYFAGFQYPDPSEGDFQSACLDLFPQYATTSVVSFGNRSMLPLSGHSQRQIVAQTMSAFRLA